MFASLPMYDRPETAAANNRLWAAIRKQLGFGPHQLTRDADETAHWLHPDLLLSQTCGMPYRLHLHGKVQLVATPIWDLPNETQGHYHSVLIMRRDPQKDDLHDGLSDCVGRTLACNMATSQSGWAAPQNHALDHGFSFTKVITTGGHIASAKAVAAKQADVAAIDAVTWQLIKRHDRATAEALKVIDRTESTPTLPYITSLTQDADALFDALAKGIQTLTAEDRATLCLKGVTKIPAEAYLAVPSPAYPQDAPHLPIAQS